MSEGGYTARRLGSGDGRAAFGLVGLYHPGVALRDWLGFVRRANRAGRFPGGVVAIESGRGVVHAVFVYSVEDEIADGRVLHVRDVVMGHLPGRVLPGAVLDAARDVARTEGLQMLRIDWPADGLTPRDEDILRGFGFSRAGAVYSGRLPVEA